MTESITFNPNQTVSSKKKKTNMIIMMVVIVAVVIGGIVIIRQPKKTEQAKSATENKEPSPTKKPNINKKTVKIQVLNGTGTPGQAGIAVTALKKAGYNTDNIKTANADNFDSTITAIKTKDGFADVASDIKDALKTTFDDINIDSASLEDESEFDIIVTTGGEKFEATTPTTSVSPTNSEDSTTPTPTVTPTPTSTPSPTPTP